jgi:ComF family protein
LFTHFLKIKRFLIDGLLQELLHLFFPNNCINCYSEIINEEKICHSCSQNIEYTYFEKSIEHNKTQQMFWGRVPVEYGFSLLYFKQSNISQKIVHEIKYKGNKNLALDFGIKMGLKLITDKKLPKIDVLLPVPLHYKKQFDRGFNQSEIIAKGIAQAMNIPLNKEIITRLRNKKSQTKLNKYLRWENTKNTYSVSTELLTKNWKHVAIVDDVITTGSTIESISKELLAINPSLKISVISLAIAI